MSSALEGFLWRVRRRVLRASPRGPSFTTRYAGARRVSSMARELGGREPVWDINRKQDAYRWVDALGVRHPMVIGEFPDVSSLDWSSLPDRCVIKPASGAGGIGVFLLERRGDTWQELRTARPVTPEVVTAQLVTLARGKKGPAPVIVEEMVTDSRRPGTAPVDWKFYTFFGAAPVAVAKAPTTEGPGQVRTRWKMFDSSWSDLGRDAFTGRDYDATIAPPRNRAALQAMAVHISAAVPRSFLRVDLYDDDRGPLFGELTPQPGGRQLFRRDIDALLGRHWEEAEARLLLRSIRAGVLAPAASELPESAAVLSRRAPDLHSD